MWDPTAKDNGRWKVIYWPKKSEDKCCDQSTKTVKMGAVQPSNTGGKEWCKVSGGRKLLASEPTPSYGRKLLETEVEEAEEEECGFSLDSVAVEAEFKVQKNQPKNSNITKPLFKIEGDMSFVYPVGLDFNMLLSNFSLSFRRMIRNMIKS